MIDFEKKFPSLMDCTVMIGDRSLGQAELPVILRNVVERHCLDKQRVREAIDFISQNEHPEMSSGWKSKLLKELGLGDEE